MSEDFEQGYKWWLRYIIVPIIGGGGIIAILIAYFNAQNHPKTKKFNPPPSINKSTQGEQSPAINSNGPVNIQDIPEKIPEGFSPEENLGRPDEPRLSIDKPRDTEFYERAIIVDSGSSIGTIQGVHGIRVKSYKGTRSATGYFVRYCRSRLISFFVSPIFCCYSCH